MGSSNAFNWAGIGVKKLNSDNPVKPNTFLKYSDFSSNVEEETEEDTANVGLSSTTIGLDRTQLTSSPEITDKLRFREGLELLCYGAIGKVNDTSANAKDGDDDDRIGIPNSTGEGSDGETVQRYKYEWNNVGKRESLPQFSITKGYYMWTSGTTEIVNGRTKIYNDELHPKIMDNLKEDELEIKIEAGGDLTISPTFKGDAPLFNVVDGEISKTYLKKEFQHTVKQDKVKAYYGKVNTVNDSREDYILAPEKYGGLRAELNESPCIHDLTINIANNLSEDECLDKSFGKNVSDEGNFECTISGTLQLNRATAREEAAWVTGMKHGVHAVAETYQRQILVVIEGIPILDKNGKPVTHEVSYWDYNTGKQSQETIKENLDYKLIMRFPNISMTKWQPSESGNDTATVEFEGTSVLAFDFDDEGKVKENSASCIFNMYTDMPRIDYPAEYDVPASNPTDDDDKIIKETSILKFLNNYIDEEPISNCHGTYMSTSGAGYFETDSEGKTSILLSTDVEYSILLEGIGVLPDKVIGSKDVDKTIYVDNDVETYDLPIYVMCNGKDVNANITLSKNGGKYNKTVYDVSSILFANLTEGTYTISIDAGEDYLPFIDDEVIIPDTKEYNAFLSESIYDFPVYVMDNKGVNVEGKVSLKKADGSYSQELQTKNGCATFTEITKGKYSINIDAGKYYKPYSAEEVNIPDTKEYNAILSEAFFDLIVRVMDSEGYTENGTVSLKNADGSYSQELKTDGGHVTFEEIPKGKYTLSVDAEYYETYIDNEVNIPDIEEYDAKLSEILYELPVHVMDDKKNKIEGTVSLKNADGSYSEELQTTDGLVTFTGITHDKYTLSVDAEYYETYIDNEVIIPDTKEYNAILSKTLYELPVHVMDNKENKVEGKVSLKNADGSYSQEISTTDGLVTFTGITHDKYTLSVDAEYYETYTDDNISIPDIKTYDAKLSEILYELPVHVIDTKGMDINGTVSLKNADRSYSKELQTNEGRVTFTGITHDKYTLSVDAEYYETYTDDEVNIPDIKTYDAKLSEILYDLLIHLRNKNGYNVDGTVYVKNADGSYSREIISENARATFTEIPHGDYDITVKPNETDKYKDTDDTVSIPTPSTKFVTLDDKE